MKVLSIGNGLFSLGHDSFSPALASSVRVIPGLVGNGKVVTGGSDAIEAAVEYLVTERGLYRSGFENVEILTPKWVKRG